MGNKITYSYHTFIFPFIWENKHVKVDGREAIRNFFDETNNKYWRMLDWKKRTNIKEQTQYYANKQYFHPAARMAVFGDDTDLENSIVNNYEFNPDYLGEGAEYIIKKEKNEYHLKINRIELRFFNTGVATFMFECINESYDEFEDIKMINDYGRRISIPYIPLKDGTDHNKHYWNGSSCADSLEFHLPKVPELKAKDDFKQLIIDFNDGKIGEDVVEKYFCQSIKEVMKIGNTDKKIFNKAWKTDDIDIEPALDDRMYVMSLFDQTLVHASEEQDFFSVLKYEGVESAADYLDELENTRTRVESLYTYTFVDATYCTCQSKTMRRELLDASSYDRWIRYGTYYSITPQAFTSMTNDALTINTFRNLYTELSILALVQRATLINFQNKSLELSKGLEKIGEYLEQKKIKQLMDLQERFIAFQNQLNLQEVSSQEQAIDLYQRLRKAEFVEELNDAITNQLDALYDATNTNQDYGFNFWAAVLAIVALCIDAPGFFFNDTGCALNIVKGNKWEAGLHIVILIGVTFWGLYKLGKYKYRRRK